MSVGDDRNFGRIFKWFSSGKPLTGRLRGVEAPQISNADSKSTEWRFIESRGDLPIEE